MNKKIIFFSIDRLGDYLIRSNVIKKISTNFDYVEIIASNLNYKLLNSQKFFNKVHLFNYNNFFEKIRFIKFFLSKSYNAAIVLDGKNISNILLLLVNSDFKFTFLYKKKGILNLIYLTLIQYIYNFLNIKYEFLFSRDLIEKNNNENYPAKYRKLNKYFSNIDNKTYYLENNSIISYDDFLNQFVIIHLDEKFADIKNINSEFLPSLIKFQKHLKKKVFLTTFNNNFKYYNNLNIEKINFANLSKKNLFDSKILVIENIPLDYFQNLMKNSYANISCHSGLFVHTSLALNKKTIDIMNKSQEIWLNSWIDQKIDYIKIYKSDDDSIYNIDEVLTLINEQITII